MTHVATTTDERAEVLGPREWFDDNRVTDHGVKMGCDCCTSAVLVEGTLPQLIAFFRDVVNQLDAANTAALDHARLMRKRFPVPAAGLWRGNHPLPPAAAEAGYDHDAALIAAHPGEQITAHRLSPDKAGQNTDYVIGWPGDDYDDLNPGEDGAVWQRFTDRAALDAWLAAYQLYLSHYPAPGEDFTVTTPDVAGFLPLT